MSDESEASVMGSLPRSRPQRRSDKRGPGEGQRAAKQPTAKRPAARQPTAKNPTAKRPAAKQPQAKPRASKQPAAAQAAKQSRDAAVQAGAARATCASSLADGAQLVGTVVQASAELAEIAFTLGVRALRTAVSRLPRP